MKKAVISSHLHIAVVFAFVLGQLPLSAQTTSPKNRTWGYAFGDLVYKAQGDTLNWGNTEYAALEKKAIGANLRRLFLGYDSKITDNIKARVLVESKATTTTKEGRYGFALIYGLLEWENVIPAIPNSKARIGLIPTPIFTLPEKTWGYRSVEKDALDLRGIGKVIDQGAFFSGDFTKDKTAGFSLMVGNGTGNKPGVDKYLEYYGSLYKKLWNNHITIEILGDYMRKSPVARQSFIRSFISVEEPKWTFGLEVSQVFAEEEVTGKIQAVNPFSFSFYLSNQLGFLGENWRSFIRYDFYNPVTEYHTGDIYGNASQNYNEHSYWLGMHYKFHERINFMPNIIINQYVRKSSSVVNRKADIVPRVTVYYLFGD